MPVVAAKSIFTRPKAVGLPRLRDSLLVLVDCSALSITQREDLFMSSRDRLSKKPLRFDIEREIENMLHANPELRRLKQELCSSWDRDSQGPSRPVGRTGMATVTGLRGTLHRFREGSTPRTFDSRTFRRVRS